MLTDLRWLALEAKDLDGAREFYTGDLYMDVAAVREGEVVMEAGGGTDLILRRPTAVPRGGLHTHYAFAIPEAEYDRWRDGLSASFDVVEHDFGGMGALYVYDPDGNCVELTGMDVDGPGIDGVFEVVLEVADLDRAVGFYGDLGFEPVDREPDRVRLTGPIDLELWEPRLGIADGRGGVHVDLGFGTADPEAALAAVEDRVLSVERPGGRIRVRDPDGHVLTFVR
jgi:catechol 2,3-dioxygenase-like lactoylglutathione lyase family enzyme